MQTAMKKYNAMMQSVPTLIAKTFNKETKEMKEVQMYLESRKKWWRGSLALCEASSRR